MANDNELKVGIGYEDEGLQAGLNKAEKAVDRFGKSTEKATTKAAKFSKQTSANATPALQEFSRVVQDAPYGMQGVANNIQQLTANFGYLSQATGGTKAALKAMVTQLAGPAGILLAVSVVTSLIVAFGDKLTDNTKAVDKNKEAQDALNSALKTQKELRSDLNTELDIATKAAVLEAKIAGKSALEVLGVQKQFTQARINILKGDITKSKALADEYRAKEVAEWKENGGEITELSKTYAESRKRAVEESLRLERELRKTEGNLMIADLRFTLEQMKQVNKEAGEAILGDVKGQVERFTETQKQAFQNIANLYGGLKDQIQPLDLNELIKGVTPETAELIKAGLSNVNDIVEDQSAKINNALQTGIIIGFTDMANSIGDAFSSGANATQSGGAALLGAIGGILKTFGGLVIAAGVASLGLEQAIKNWFAGGGVVAIAAGAALVAAGAAVSSFASNLGKSNTSTSSSSGGVGSTSFSGSTVGASTPASSSGGTYVFEIEGTKLVGVLSNTLARNRALGGNLSLNGT